MEYTYYGFKNCVGGFFEMSTSDARALLPSHLQPVELQHSRSILALTAFQFTESEVGAYNEIVLAILVPPLVEPGKPLPNAAFYPFMVGTDTEASRRHAIERWHLPHHPTELEIQFNESDGQMDVNILDGGSPVLDLVVTAFDCSQVKNLYHCFMAANGDRYKATIHMEGPHAVHEEEGGSLTLYGHPMTAGLTVQEVNSFPFREEWYKAGVQTFEPLETL